MRAPAPDARAEDPPCTSRSNRRGLATEAGDLLVTTGSRRALTLVAVTLLVPGAVVAVEELTHLAALQCFQLAGPRVVPVASDDDGIDPNALAAVVERKRPTLLYLVPMSLVPTFAVPTGRTLTAARRTAVADPDSATLRLSFTTSTPDESLEGMRRLGAVLRHLPSSGGIR